MQANAVLAFSSALLLISCIPTGGQSLQGPPAPALSEQQKIAIGRKIWQNECAGTIDGLTSWNHGEEFPSLGIGHFIWYPRGVQGPFRESWPQFVAYARSRGEELPAVALKEDCPWPDRASFEADRQGPELSGLRRWLAARVALQTDFIVQRSLAALPDVLAVAPAGERERIAANYRKVATTPQGVYALIDYVNFKGDGTLLTERYQGQGWGLLQVLGEMREVGEGPAAAREFGAAASRVL
ncbi:MAG TPA: hypothetical protein VFY13_01000, partial [Luteolibacter sp.]|nr:hypothetical protein [Luteolibacter sp.]